MQRNVWATQMLRCKACNIDMTKITERVTDEGIRLPEDLCKYCRAASGGLYNYMDDHEYALEDSKEGLKEPLFVDY